MKKRMFFFSPDDAGGDTGISQDSSDLLSGEVNQDVTGANQDKAGQGTEGDAAGEEGDKTFPAWMSQLTGDLKTSEGLTKFKNISELGKAYGELEGKLGNSITIPGEDATKEDKAALWNRLGRPETEDGYELTLGENIPDHIKTALKGDEAELKKFMHSNGFTKEQGAALNSYIQEKVLGAEKLQTMLRNKQYNEGAELLKEAWGGDFDKNLNTANVALNRFVDKESMAFLKETGLANHPGMVRMMHKIGQSISEDSFIDGGDAGNNFDPSNHVLFT